MQEIYLELNESNDVMHPDIWKWNHSSDVTYTESSIKLQDVELLRNEHFR